MDAQFNKLITQWARAGAAFNISPAQESPDLERLLLDTARFAPKEPRLFIMAATWLCKFGDLIATHRLSRLIVDELEREHRPTLGLLLDIVREQTGTAHFNSAIKECAPNSEPQPLFNIERSDERLHRLAHRHASAISRAWNLWAQPIEMKPDALQSAHWIMRENPEYQSLADFKGDLRASIIAALRDDATAGESELELARRCGATRAAIRDALESLEISGRIERHIDGKRRKVSLITERTAA